MTTVGFIGLGSQGGPIARRIASKFPLVLWARRPDALAAYADTKADTVTSIAELGRRCDHVGMCVVNDADVQQVCAELIPAMRKGSRIVIHSTVHPHTCVALADQAATHGVALIDAPVSGGGSGAADGTLTVMVGGAAETLAAARPVLESFAGLITHLGGVGAGQKAKLINNTLMAANLAVAHYAITTATTLGLDRAALTELINVSSGRSFGFEVAARMVAPAAFVHGAKLLDKDVRLLGETLGETAAPHSAEAAFAALRDVTQPFLDKALQG